MNEIRNINAQVLGLALRTCREEQGISQSALARQIGVVRQVINQYERGRNVPSLAMACQMADALGVSLDALAGRCA